jgi:hypothetical protein
MPRLLVMASTVCLLGFPIDAATQRKEGKMADPRADQIPERLVLDGVPKVRYLKDGLCPFALCLKSCTDYMGDNYPYHYILAASGACFRMSWNFTEWDEGNMDLGALGPEPFRRGLRAVGLKHTFLLKNSWWPDSTGDDVEAMDDSKKAEAAFRAKIVDSIRAGKPVLAFGVVGPPEVSIVTGYDQGGDVLIGWSCFQGEHPKDQLEPNGMFRQREWFARTQGIMLVERQLDKPDMGRVYHDALEWAYRVSTLPKGKTHLFGRPAYKEWAEGMLKDLAFPADDEKTLQSRRYTVWDGLIMLAERGHVAKFLEDAAQLQPDVAQHLREAARLLKEEGECGARVTKALGGHRLPSEHLADPCARRSAVDAILDARDKNAEALRHLALALGKEPPGFVFDGKQLQGLRPARRWMTLLGCIKGCMRHLDKDVDDAWLYGVTGAAFMLNIDAKVDVSGPTSWDTAHLRKMAPRLGISLTNEVLGRKAGPDLAQKQQAARAFVRQKIDAGRPCYAWDGCLEFFTVNGYDEAGWLEWSHYYEEGYKHKPWAKLGHNITEVFYVISVEPVDAAVPDQTVVKEALDYALAQRPSGKPLDPKHAQGLQGYDLWIQCLENGDWRKPGLPGVHHNVACWHECRCYAERFLRLAGEKIGGNLQPLFDEAAGHYRAVRMALGKMQAIFIYKYPLPPVDQAGVARGVELLRTAKEEETKGLEVIEKIVRELSRW